MSNPPIYSPPIYASGFTSLQAAIDQARQKSRRRVIIDTDLIITSRVDATGVVLAGEERPEVTFAPTDSSITLLFNPFAVEGVRFIRPLPDVHSSDPCTAIEIVNGYRHWIERTANRVNRCLFDSNHRGLHVVDIPVSNSVNKASTTFQSQGNYFVDCERGLWIEEEGAGNSTGNICSSSINDVFQHCTDIGLFLFKTWWPFSLFNPYFGDGNNVPWRFQQSRVHWIGGYTPGTQVGEKDNVTEIYVMPGCSVPPFNSI